MENANQKQLYIGELMVRYALVIILLWVGCLKFTSYEAEGIKGLVENSPLLSWSYNVTSVQGLSNVIGIIEIALGILIALRYKSPKLSVIGSYGAIIMFLITLSFVFTTPGVWQAGMGFPFLSPMPGQFLAKDVLLLSVAVWCAAEAKAALQINAE